MVAPVQKSKLKQPTAKVGPSAKDTPQAHKPAAGTGMAKDASSARAGDTEATDAIDLDDIQLDGGDEAGAGQRKGKKDDGKNSVSLGYDTKNGEKTSVTFHATDKVTLEAHTAEKKGKTQADATVRYKDETLDATVGYDTEKGANGGVSVKATHEITLSVHAAENETASAKSDKSEKPRAPKPQATTGQTKTPGGKGQTGKTPATKPAAPKAPEGPHVDAAIDYKGDQTTAHLGFDTKKGVSGTVSQQLDERWKVTASAGVQDGKTNLGGKVNYKDKATQAELGYSTKDGVSGKVAYQPTKELKLEADAAYHDGKTKAHAKGTYKIENTTVQVGYDTKKGIEGSVTQKLDDTWSVGASVSDTKKFSAMVKYQQQNLVVTTQVGSINKIEAAYKKDNWQAGAFVSHDSEKGTAAGVSLKLSF